MGSTPRHYVLAVRMELTYEQLLTLAGRSEMLREDPRAGWSVGEMKQHARHAITLMALRAADRGMGTD